MNHHRGATVYIQSIFHVINANYLYATRGKTDGAESRVDESFSGGTKPFQRVKNPQPVARQRAAEGGKPAVDTLIYQFKAKWKPKKSGRDQKQNRRGDTGTRSFILLSYQLVLLWQCTLEKQRKALAEKPTISRRVTRFRLHRPVAEWTAPYIIIAKGHFQLKLISKQKDIKIKFVIT